MSRISSYAVNTQLINRLLTTQNSILDRQTQLNTGKVSQDYAGIALDSQRLINIENTRDRLERYTSNNLQQETRLAVAQTSVESIRTSINDFKKELTAYSAGRPQDENNVKIVQESAFRALRNMEDMLNTQVDGRYLFSGSRARTSPVDLGIGSITGFQSTFDGARVTVPTTRDAHLEDFSFDKDENNQNSLFIEDGNFLRFTQDSDGNTTTAGSGTIRASSAMFSNLTAGASITVANTASNNGTYTVESVSSDGQTVTVKTEMLTDETLAPLVTTETPVGPISFVGENNTTVNATTASTVAFDATTNTITASGADAGLFSTLTAGDYVTFGSTTNNNLTYKVRSIDATNSIITVDTAASNIALANGDDVSTAESGNLTFSRSGDTIVATNAVFSGVSVGETIVVSGTDENAGTYTVSAVSTDGRTVTVESKKITDEGLSGTTFFDYHALSEVTFTAGTNTIQILQDDGTTAIANAFNGLAVGDQITVANSVSNNGTLTVASIGSDGSSITVSETLTAEANVATGVTFTGSGNGFSQTTRTYFSYDATGETITATSQAAAAVPGVFSGLSVGETFTITGGTNPGTYTVSAVSSDGSQITVNEDIGTTVADTAVAAQMQVFGADGTVSATSYYKGDELALTHRVDDDRDFDFDVQASDPAFEKAIRAMKLILQGEFGTEGGLDQNPERISQALYLLNDALTETTDGTPPFGTELVGSIEQTEQDIGFSRSLMSQINETNTSFIGFLEKSIAEVENTDELDVLTRLLDDQQSLEASYQTFARIRQLSLTNFL